jgi:thiosulfate/3-mercaptopyruvate sulfurtransferase
MGLLASLIWAVAATSAFALDLPGPLVETGWLSDHQGEVVVLDVREESESYLGQSPASDAKPDLKKLSGHIPGAIAVPWKQVVAKSEERGVALKAMLPTSDAFAGLMQASGVSNGSTIVIAGLGRNAKDQAHAARLYFTLKYFGHDKVALLDGGTAQWAMEGRPLAYETETTETGDFQVLEVREHLLVGTPEVEAAAASGGQQLVDCRTEDFFLGLTAKRDFVAEEHKGHLAGAKSLPFVMLGDNTGPARFYALEDMRKVAELKDIALDVPTIVYCNTGVTASLGWYALHELLGNPQTRLYDGSMHAWSKVDPAHAVTSLGLVNGQQAAEKGGEAAVADVEATPPALDVQGYVPSPPRSVQNLIDERRDLQRQRRRERFDAYAGRPASLPIGLAAYDDAVERYRDGLRQMHRQRRDYDRWRHDSWMDALCPWSKPQREWTRQRSYLMQLEQLDRQEWWDAHRYGTPVPFTGPARW